MPAVGKDPDAEEHMELLKLRQPRQNHYQGTSHGSEAAAEKPDWSSDDGEEIEYNEWTDGSDGNTSAGE